MEPDGAQQKQLLLQLGYELQPVSPANAGLYSEAVTCFYLARSFNFKIYSEARFFCSTFLTQSPDEVGKKSGR